MHIYKGYKCSVSFDRPLLSLYTTRFSLSSLTSASDGINTLYIIMVCMKETIAFCVSKVLCIKSALKGYNYFVWIPNQPESQFTGRQKKKKYILLYLSADLFLRRTLSPHQFNRTHYEAPSHKFM